jgi:superfamily I DNA/RNA helicase
MEITAVTFTNKAANEMKKRLGVLGQKDADALILGTLISFIHDASEDKADNRHVSCDLCKVPKAVWPTNRPTQQFLNHRCG